MVSEGWFAWTKGIYFASARAEEIQGHTVIFNQSKSTSDLLRRIEEKELRANIS
jgi:hypothetical protein